MHKPSIRLTTAICAAALAIGTVSRLQATTYYWIPGMTQGIWDAQENGFYYNWSMEGLEGTTATTLPGSGDALYQNGDYNLDLDGKSYTLASWPTPSDWDNHYLTLANGILTFTGEVSTHSGQINVDAEGAFVLPSGSSFVPGIYSSSGMMINVNNGGTMSVAGTVRLYNGSFAIANGGSLTFAPSNLRFGAEAHNYALTFSNSGTLSLPNGFSFNRWDTATVNAGATYSFLQMAGTLNLGGPIANAPSSSSSLPGPFSVVFSGGIVNVMGNVTFNVTSFTVENSITFNVSPSALIDLTPASFAAGSSITKTGAGYVKLPTTAPTAAISAGALMLDANTYDLSSVTFAADTGIALNPVGGRVNSSDSSIANATFTATIPATAGTAIFYSTDSALLTKVKSDLDASVPSGFQLVVSGDMLSVEAETGASFTVTGDILSASCWGGTVPAAGLDVAIDGANVVATLSSGETLPEWNSIEVKNGATLRIETDAALPAIVLNKNATLEIAGNATVSFASLTGAVATSPSLVVPVLSIESGAKLNVPGGMKFSNVNINLEGAITVTTAGGVTFGYAAAGETSYVGFFSNGGTISLNCSGSDYDSSPLRFCCPDSGGTVVALSELTLKDSTINPRYVRSDITYDFTDRHQVGFHLGRNNPTNELFEVVFDNTKYGVCGQTKICGGATFRLKNGGKYVNLEAHGLWNRNAEITGMGRIIVETGCEFRMNAMGDYGKQPLAVNPGYADHEAIVVEESGIFECYRTSGNGNGVMAVSNAIYQIYIPWITNDVFAVETVNQPFAGLGAVKTANNTTLTFSTRNRVFWDSGQFFDESGDRVVTLADVPITGGGSIVVSNANANVFGVIVQSGANTATGTASVTAPAAGLGATTLYFADGANWAGTVVADGNVVLTNLTDGASSTSVTFGSLDLTENFPIRVWNNAGTLANDKINVDAYVANGGKLTPVLVNGDVWPSGTSFEVGKIAKGAELPPLAKNWVASVKSIDNDDDYDMLCLRYFKGTQIILR